MYGDSPELPKVESRVGQPLSPYAVTKATNELYAHAMSSLYEMQLVGFRYFNVFGPRQDPAGAYAAVVPKWIKLLQDGKDCEVYGDGETSRDFCFVKNVVEANLRAALISLPKPCCEVYNVACGEQTSLNQLYALLSEGLVERGVALEGRVLQQRPFRAGDVRHSLADITLARQRIGYSPRYSLRDGVVELLDWAVSHG